jgi:hypothetical protein
MLMAGPDTAHVRVQLEGRVQHVEIPEDCRFFTVAQACGMLQVSRQFLYVICDRGTGPPMVRFKNGKRVVIRFPILGFRQWMLETISPPTVEKKRVHANNSTR